MKKSKSVKLLMGLVVCCTLLTGCWDKIEIEDRLFVLAIGLDKAEGTEGQDMQNKLSISFVSPVLAEIKEGSGPAYKTYKTTASTFTMAPSNLWDRFAKMQFFGHTRVMLFGEALMKDEKLMKEINDAFQRSHDIHQSMLVFVVPGKAEDVFKVEPMYDRLLATYITGIADNSTYTAKIMKQTLSEFLIKINSQKGSVIIPGLIPMKEEVRITGAGVIKDYRLAGYLDDTEGRVQNWLMNQAQGGSIPVKYEGTDIVFRYFTFRRKIKLDRVEAGKLYMTYDFETEGAIEEYLEGKELLDDALLKKMEKVIEKAIEESSLALIHKYQKDFKVDLIGVQDYLSKYHPELYKEIKKDYQQYFTEKMVLETKATVQVRRVGLAK